MEKLLLVDGNALMHRAYHAIPFFKTSKGIPTNVLYGFLSILHKAITDFNPQHVLVCFDTPAPTFRNELLETYQAQRPSIDDDFRVQIPFVKEALDRGRIVHMEKDGYEADDLIGTISSHYRKNGLQVFILSGDKDLMQLVGGNVFAVTPQIGFSKTKIYSPAEVKERLGVAPEQIPDYKAIAGDPSDNYIGAKGIGPKTAVKLLEKYGSLQGILDAIPGMEEGKVKKILELEKENILIAKKLATILTDVPLDFDLEKTDYAGFHDELKTYLTGFEMNSIIKRLFERKTNAPPAKKPSIIKEEKPQLSLF